jgi:1-phosphofructokinase
MSDRVMVFAPVPVLTVTIEQQADAVELHLHPGGQGVWQARMLALLGVEVLNVTRHGLGTGRLDAIQELMGRVELVSLDRETGQP